MKKVYDETHQTASTILQVLWTSRECYWNPFRELPLTFLLRIHEFSKILEGTKKDLPPTVVQTESTT